ncbi:MAG: alpha/beta fold hydrolase [Dehalococcoidia bacterium]
MMVEPKSNRVLVNGINMHYWDWEGNGPPMVMLHPSTGFGRMWDWVARELHPRYRILALDQRGHGDSEKPKGSYAAEEYAADLDAFAGALGLERFILAGNSLGVRVGIIYAAQRAQKVSHFIQVGGPHYSFLAPGEDVEAWQTRARETRAAPRRFASAAEAKGALHASRPSLSEEALEHIVQHNTNRHPDGSVEWKYDSEAVADGLAHALDDLRGYVRGIRCPTLMLRAEKSWELTPERMPQVEALFPTARWVTIEGAVYSLQLEKPAAVARAIRGFLEETAEA